MRKIYPDAASALERLLFDGMHLCVGGFLTAQRHGWQSYAEDRGDEHQEALPPTSLLPNTHRKE
jgi:hypothetical protein